MSRDAVHHTGGAYYKVDRDSTQHHDEIHSNRGKHTGKGRYDLGSDMAIRKCSTKREAFERAHSGMRLQVDKLVYKLTRAHG